MTLVDKGKQVDRHQLEGVAAPESGPRQIGRETSSEKLGDEVIRKLETIEAKLSQLLSRTGM